MGLAIAPGAPRPPAVTAASWLVADLGSGAVLGGCGPHESHAPASVQKLLLAATMMPRLDPASVIEVTPGDMDFEPDSSAMGLVQGGRYRVQTLWLGLLIKSGNDAANVLARVGGGAAGRQGGIEAMNDEAQRLGAHQTHAVTASGYDGIGQYTSAYDLALIARACYARDDFRRYTATRQAEVPVQPGKKDAFQITNDNSLLDKYPGMLGGKTGFTDLARHTYVGVAERNGRRLVVTLLGAEAKPIGSLTEATSLLDWGFKLPSGMAVGRLVEPDQASPSSTAAANAAAAEAPAPHATRGLFNGPPIVLAGAAGVAVLAVLGIALVAARDRRRPATAPRDRRRRPDRDGDQL
jgi:D-alanyl-D-alanine carboxypeptidase (penicillin-binding protein 5/6)